MYKLNTNMRFDAKVFMNFCSFDTFSFCPCIVSSYVMQQKKKVSFNIKEATIDEVLDR